MAGLFKPYQNSHSSTTSIRLLRLRVLPHSNAKTDIRANRRIGLDVVTSTESDGYHSNPPLVLNFGCRVPLKNDFVYICWELNDGRFDWGWRHRFDSSGKFATRALDRERSGDLDHHLKRRIKSYSSIGFVSQPKVGYQNGVTQLDPVHWIPRGKRQGRHIHTDNFFFFWVWVWIFGVNKTHFVAWDALTRDRTWDLAINSRTL